MRKFSVDEVKGVVINEGTVHERCVKLLASPDCLVKREGYACGMAVIDPGQIHEEHAHDQSQELILVFRGTGIGRIAGEEISLAPGDLIAIEKGEPHTFSNTGSETLYLYWIYSPPGAEKKFLTEQIRAVE
ncbi:MAG: cupin domain-containing protein [Clostridiales bacterium]|nr:cupin domain-containing protein [Clostridiales bacterium]